MDTMSLFHDPRVLAGMLQAGLALSQPPVNGQTQFGHIGEALSEGIAAAGRVDVMARQRAEQEMQLQMQQQKLEQDPMGFGANLAQVRAQTAATQEATQRSQELLPLQKERLQAEIGETKAQEEYRKEMAKAYQEGKLPMAPGGWMGDALNDPELANLPYEERLKRIFLGQKAPDLKIEEDKIAAHRQESLEKELHDINENATKQIQALRLQTRSAMLKAQGDILWKRMSPEQQEAQKKALMDDEAAQVAKVEAERDRLLSEKQNGPAAVFDDENKAAAAAQALANKTGKHTVIKKQGNSWTIGFKE